MSELKLSHTVSADGTTLNATVSGRLTIDNTFELMDLFRQNTACRNARINLEALEEIDISGMQLICTACRTWINAEKTLQITGTYPESISNIVRQAGLDSQKSCRQHPEIQCIWHEGAN